jgi:hypothetical protein
VLPIKDRKANKLGGLLERYGGRIIIHRNPSGFRAQLDVRNGATGRPEPTVGEAIDALCELVDRYPPD